MFLRFSKGAFIKGADKKKYRKAVLINDTVIMEYGNDLVGLAVKFDEKPKSVTYHICVATQNELDPARIARAIKDMIGKSNKFTDKPSTKRRIYDVEEYHGKSLPYRAGIILNYASKTEG